MAKVIVIYESKYGNTRLVAESLAEGINSVSGIETQISELSETALDALAGYDAIVIGTPNHIGNATRGIRKFIDQVGKLNLKDKPAAVFDTCLGMDYEKAVRKLEKHITSVAPGLRLIEPGLSVRVGGIKGPVTEGELPRSREFGVRIANSLSA